MNKDSTETSRDYSHEYRLRKRRLQRLGVDVDKETAAALKQQLARQGLTFTKWIKNKIRDEMNKG